VPDTPLPYQIGKLMGYGRDQKRFVRLNRLEPGSRVKVKQRMLHLEEYGYWPETWVESMDQYIGKEMFVISVGSDGICLSCNNKQDKLSTSWLFPYFVLEMVDKTDSVKVPDEEEI